MKNKENVSDSDSNSSSSWIIINKESPIIREEIQDVELSEKSDIESDSDGISVISESDSLNEEKCMDETYDDIINYKEFDDYKCNKIVCSKTSQCDSDNLGFWGVMSCILCACLSAFVTLHGHLYLKQTEYEIKTMAIVIDSTVGCVDAFQIHEMNYNKSYLKQCVVSTANKVGYYGVSVEEAIRRFNFNKSKTIPFNISTKEDLKKKFKNPVQKSKCKKKKPIQNNSNNKNKDTNIMKATCKLKGKKGNFKKNKNKDKDITGEWYLDLHKARNEIRSREHDADWFFDRANIRNKKRNSAMWYFSYMKMREKYRFKSSKKENL